MALLILLLVTYLINTIESNSCVQKEFTKTPREVQNSCDSEENVENRWRGELSYNRSETYIEVQWKKIVQDPDCVKAMEFFVDDVKAKDIWGSHKENIKIDKNGQFSLKVQVFFLVSGTSGNCYGSGNRCRCFEATKNFTVQDGNDDNVPSGNGDNGEQINESSPSSPLTLAAASGGVVLVLALLLTLAICVFKQRGEERIRQEKAEEEEMTANTDENNVYGIYAMSNEETDYSLVTDTNPDYE